MAIKNVAVEKLIIANLVNEVAPEGVISIKGGELKTTVLNTVNWNEAYDKRIDSLTTTGTSGAATLISNVLNIPNYANDIDYVSNVVSDLGVLTFTGVGNAFNGTADLKTYFDTIYGSGDGIVESLTTSGNNGSATLIAGVLNVPTYTLAGLGYVAPTLPATISAVANRYVDSYTSGTGIFTTSLLPFVSLTTTGTSGNATLISGVLNIPNYADDNFYLSGVTHNATNVSLIVTGASNQTINAATASLAGVVTNAAQTFGGDKTFNNKVIVGDTTSAPLEITRTSQVGIFFNNTTNPNYLGSSSGNLYWGSSANHALNNEVLHTGNFIAGTDYQVPVILTTVGTSGASTFDGTTLNIPQYQAAGTYDNYVSWNLKTNGVQRIAVVSGGTLDIVGGTNTTATYTAGGVVTIASTDTNNYISNVVSALGVLTFTGIGSAFNGTADLKTYFDTIYGSGDGIVESLTTTGTSGAATLIGGILNVPNYAPDLSGYLLNTTDTLTGTLTVTANTNSPLTITGEVRTDNGTELVLNAGESATYATGQTGELVYVNAEGGFQVNSSPDNWGSGWAGRKTATINNASGDSSFPGKVTSINLTLSGLANQASEATALMINGSNVVGTRELGSNAFTSNNYLLDTTDIFTGALTINGGDAVLYVSNTVDSNSFVNTRMTNDLGYAQFGTLSGFARIYQDGSSLYAGNNSIQYHYIGGAIKSTLNATGLTLVGTLISQGIGDSSFVGNVGIGTTAPGLKTEILGPSGYPATSGAAQTGILRLSNSSGSQVLDMGVNNTTGTGWLQATSSSSLGAIWSLALNPNGGNVGIGTTTPLTNLDVSDAVLSEIRLTNTDTSLVDEQIASTLSFYNNDASSNGVGVKASINAISDSTFGNRIGLTFHTSTDAVGTAEVMRIDSDGKVGIGTTNPGRKLTISDSDNILFANSSGNAYMTLDRASANLRNAFVFSTAGNGTSAIPNNIDWAMGSADSDDVGDGSGFFIGTTTQATSAKLFIDSTGSVGIGTTTPNTTTHIKHTVNGEGLTLQMITGTADQYTQLGFLPSTSDLTAPPVFIRGHRGSTFASSYMTLGTNTTEQVRIDGDGNVGIGTTSPTADFQVGDGTTAPNTRTYYSDGSYVEGLGYGFQFSRTISYLRPTITDTLGMYIGSSAQVWDSSYVYSNTHRIYNGVTEAMRVEGGKVGIGTTSPDTKFQVTDGILVNDQSAAFNTTKFNSQGVAWSADLTRPSLVFNAGAGDRPEIAWLRGSNTYPEFAIRQHTTSNKGGTIYSGTGTSLPIATMTFDNGNVGIGITLPTHKLDVRDATGSTLIALTDTNGTLTTSNPYLSFWYGATPTRLGYVGYGSASNNDLYLSNDTGNIRLNADAIHIITTPGDATSTAPILRRETTGIVVESTPAELLGDIGAQPAADYLRADIADVKSSGTLTFNDSVSAGFGDSNDMAIWHNGGHGYINAVLGNVYIQDAGVTRFTFSTTGGNFTATGLVNSALEVRTTGNSSTYHGFARRMTGLAAVGGWARTMAKIEITEATANTGFHIGLKGTNGIYDAGYIGFNNVWNDANKMTITPTGEVGIGMAGTLPSEKLEVNEGYISSTTAGGAGGFVLKRDALDTYQLRHLDGGLTVYNLTNARKEMTFDGAGFVGIRESNPDATLHVNSLSNDLVAKFESTDSLAYIQIVDNTDSAYISSVNNHAYIGGGAGATAINLAIDLVDGDVGIGKVTPTVSLDIVSSDASGIHLYRNSGNNSIWIQNDAHSVYFGMNTSNNACIGHSTDMTNAPLQVTSGGAIIVKTVPATAAEASEVLRRNAITGAIEGSTLQELATDLQTVVPPMLSIMEVAYNVDLVAGEGLNGVAIPPFLGSNYQVKSVTIALHKANVTSGTSTYMLRKRKVGDGLMTDMLDADATIASAGLTVTATNTTAGVVQTGDVLYIETVSVQDGAPQGLTAVIEFEYSPPV